VKIFKERIHEDDCPLIDGAILELPDGTAANGNTPYSALESLGARYIGPFYVCHDCGHAVDEWEDRDKNTVTAAHKNGGRTVLAREYEESFFSEGRSGTRTASKILGYICPRCKQTRWIAKIKKRAVSAAQLHAPGLGKR